MHRDVKPENLLIDHKFRLIIADLNFASRLKKVNSSTEVKSQCIPIRGYESNGQGIFGNQLTKPCLYNPNVELSQVGSEAFNAPELWE